MSDVFNQKINESKLRDCQIEAYAALKSHFSSSSANKHVLIQLPTGTGKSALISIIPFQLAKKKVLIITPNLTLSEQLKDDLDIINNPNKNVYEKFEIFPAATLAELELHVLKLDSNGNYSDIDNYQIIVSNYHQFGDIEKWFKDRKDIFDLIIIDEAHHQNAKTYQEIIAFFSDCKIISLTATPFRSDNSKVEGEKIYSFSFKRAIQSKYIRNIKAQSISPDQIELSFLDQNNTKYSLNEIMKMKENAWFRKGIAFSQDCCDSIASLAKSKLISLRTNFPNEFHQIIAVAMSIRHAREFVKLAFEKLNLRVGIVSSEDKSTNTEVLKKLKKEKIDVIIHVGMIGEGFDHNRLGVAAIFRPFASLNPYIQFIGRVIRNNGSTKYSYVVSHLGLNQIKRFEEFKLFDSDDEEFLQELLKVSGTNTQTIGSEDSFINESNENEEKETKSQIARINETGDKTVNVESQFFNDDKVTSVKEAIDSLSEEEKKKLFLQLGYKLDVTITTKTKSRRIDPQAKRISNKNNLNELAKSITTDILKNIGLSGKQYYNRDFNYRSTNFAWIQAQISRDINKKLNIQSGQRNKLTNEQLEEFQKSEALSSIKSERTIYFQEKLRSKGK